MRSREIGGGVPRSFFSRLYNLGFARAYEWEIKDWYGKERLTDRDWSRLLMDWQDYLEDENAKFYARTLSSSLYLFLSERFMEGIEDDVVSNEQYGGKRK